MQPKRRKIVIAAAAAGAAGLTAGFWWRHRPPPDEHARHVAPLAPPDAAFPNPLRLPGSEGLFGVVDVSGPLTIVAKPVQHSLYSGKPANMLAYEVEHQGRTFLNPILKVRMGATFRAKFWNALDEISIIHWHGLHVDANNDGHPHYAIPGGAIYQYQFQVSNRAATYWYHPHPHGITGKQVHLGLAGVFIVEDDEEIALQKALDLTLGITDVPLLIQDKRVNEDGALHYAPTDDERFGGYFGNEVLVNLTPRPYFEAATRIYRFRIVNGSNARAYRLSFTSASEQLEYRLIGTDGGLLERPLRVRELFLSAGERADVLLDLSRARIGESVLLRSLPFEPMHQEAGDDPHKGHDMSRMGPGGHGQSMLPDGAAFDIMQIRITRKMRGGAVPELLSTLHTPEVPATEPRVLTLDHQDRHWRINGLRFDMKATPIVVKRGNREIWEIRNVKASMPHPMHLHAFPFQVVARNGSPEQVRRIAINERGLTASDLGDKDTVLVWPGETVRLQVDFSHSFPGDQVYLVHCHNLEHEDGGMMLNLKVAAY